MSIVLATSFMAAATIPANAAKGDITTVAGNYNFYGDGGPATLAALENPRGLAVDGAGNLYIADAANNRVRRVSPDGIITTYAGNGAAASTGDGGLATKASLNLPTALAADGSGNLFISEVLGSRVRKVSAAGIITTVAGTGVPGFSGDGGPATSARMYGVLGLATDSAGNLFIADSDSNRVRRVGTDGIITTFAGNGLVEFSGDGGRATAASLDYPTGIAVAANGDLFISDTRHWRVRRVDASGTITTFAGNGIKGYSGNGGPATSAAIIPVGLDFDGAGNLFIVHSESTIRRVSPDGIISRLGSDMSGMYGVAADVTGDVFFTASVVDKVGVVTPGGEFRFVAGNGNPRYWGDGVPGTSAILNQPTMLARDNLGNLYINDRQNQRIRRLSPDGIITTVAGTGEIGFSGDGGPATAATLSSPDGLAVDADGNLYIADTRNHRIRKVSRDGVITTVAGTGQPGFSGDWGPPAQAALSWPADMAFDSEGNLFFIDAGNLRVRAITPSGAIVTVAGNGTSADTGDGGLAIWAPLRSPRGLAVDGSGNLYIGDYFGRRVRAVIQPLGFSVTESKVGLTNTGFLALTGIIIPFAGTGAPGSSGDGGPALAATFVYPSALAVGPSGDLYIADTYADTVRRVSTTGVISTVAGNGTTGFSGDGGPASLATLRAPSGLAVGENGDLYISDTYNNRVRMVAR